MKNSKVELSRRATYSFKARGVQTNTNGVCRNVATCASFVPGDETAQVGSADRKLSPVFGALQCPDHTG